LEDRIVKHFFKDESTSNLPKNLPVIDLPDTKMELITRKPVYPSDQEYERNPRSKSAKLRAARKK
jgi:16S rRNA (cytosine1402-N4)-methyltransferase